MQLNINCACEVPHSVCGVPKIHSEPKPTSLDESAMSRPYVTRTSVNRNYETTSEFTRFHVFDVVEMSNICVDKIPKLLSLSLHLKTRPACSETRGNCMHSDRWHLMTCQTPTAMQHKEVSWLQCWRMRRSWIVRLRLGSEDTCH